jgi:hypothetical protein
MKFFDVLSNHLGNIVIPEADANKMVDELVDAALEIIHKPKVDLRQSDPAWSILANEPISQESIDQNVLDKEARDEFERVFGFNPPWFSSKDWKDFADFVAKVYKQDKAGRNRQGNVWLDYCLWREQETGGKFGKAMTNVGIRKNPRAFMDTAIPTFLAASVMYGRKTEPVEDDDNDVPRTY